MTGKTEAATKDRQRYSTDSLLFEMDNGGARGGGPGLPRHTFADDPFFHDPRNDVFSDFGTNARRRFGGSNPRIFEDDFFDNFNNGGGFGNEPSFFRSSLPRRGTPLNTSSFERPSHMQRQQTTPQNVQENRSPTQQRKNAPDYSMPQQQPQQPNIHHQRQSSSGSNYGGGGMSHQQPGGNVHVIHVQQQPQQPASSFVEVNNADPSSYTNGQLNPDKRRRFSANGPQQNYSDSPNDITVNNSPSIKIPTVKVEDYSNKRDRSASAAHSPAISEQPIPLPPPVYVQQQEQSPEYSSQKSTEFEDNSQTRPGNMANESEAMPLLQNPPKNFVPLASCTEQLVNLLDETERRVEQMREAASQLEQEKEAVLDILNNVKLTSEILKLEKSDEEDVNITAERILKRCKAVDVVVNTPRNEDQARALEDVNKIIQSVVTKMQDDLTATKETVQRFLNACSPDEPNGPIDQRFQIKIVECTADDQKKIRRKLAQIIAQIELAEKTCQPVN
ncbi:BAG family molecular chaperone regulator 2 [Ditylenchus destructor]|nr:BAG family molecular chaperone regulator 2 [Ditylenchus destructor]